jgi:hypothetical protein
MYIKRAYGFFINLISTIVLGLITSGVIMNFKNNKGFINFEVLASASLLYLVVILIIVYTYSNKIIIDGKILKYESVFETKSVNLKDVESVKYEYLNHNVRTIFPVLHIKASDETIEIPYYLFERDIDEIIVQINKYIAS